MQQPAAYPLSLRERAGVRGVIQSTHPFQPPQHKPNGASSQRCVDAVSTTHPAPPWVRAAPGGTGIHHPGRDRIVDHLAMAVSVHNQSCLRVTRAQQFMPARSGLTRSPCSTTSTPPGSSIAS